MRDTAGDEKHISNAYKSDNTCVARLTSVSILFATIGLTPIG